MFLSMLLDVMLIDVLGFRSVRGRLRLRSRRLGRLLRREARAQGFREEVQGGLRRQQKGCLGELGAGPNQGLAMTREEHLRRVLEEAQHVVNAALR